MFIITVSLLWLIISARMCFLDNKHSAGRTSILTYLILMMFGPIILLNLSIKSKTNPLTILFGG